MAQTTAIKMFKCGFNVIYTLARKIAESCGDVENLFRVTAVFVDVSGSGSGSGSGSRLVLFKLVCFYSSRPPLNRINNRHTKKKKNWIHVN